MSTEYWKCHSLRWHEALLMLSIAGTFGPASCTVSKRLREQ
jgi:hypothetical protein